MNERPFAILIGIIGGSYALVWNRSLAVREYQRQVGKKRWAEQSPEKMIRFLRWLYVVIGVIFLLGGLRALL